jgi:hypothetical protein
VRDLTELYGLGKSNLPSWSARYLQKGQAIGLNDGTRFSMWTFISPRQVWPMLNKTAAPNFSHDLCLYMYNAPILNLSCVGKDS